MSYLYNAVNDIVLSTNNFIIGHQFYVRGFKELSVIYIKTFLLIFKKFILVTCFQLYAVYWKNEFKRVSKLLPVK